MRSLAAAFRLAGLDLLARRRRILALVAFAALFLAAAVTAATLGRDDGHVEMDALFQVGGYPLVSGLLLAGWLIGRFPMVASLVLLAGIIADDRDGSRARLLAVRPASPVLLYGTRFLGLSALAFALSAVLLPLFDTIMLGRWGGSATLVLILAHVLVWGGLTTLLSVLTSLDAWIALLLGLFAMVWTSLATAGMTPLAPPIAEVVTFLLPPIDALFALESAFADVAPIPWGAFWFCAGYGAVMLVTAAYLMRRREI
ncbi:MAG: hypothetical protein P8177_06995 [Gemmatimonadota bacterium]